jgi:hypothetical protein
MEDVADEKMINLKGDCVIRTATMTRVVGNRKRCPVSTVSCFRLPQDAFLSVDRLDC